MPQLVASAIVALTFAQRWEPAQRLLDAQSIARLVHSQDWARERKHPHLTCHDWFANPHNCKEGI